MKSQQTSAIGTAKRSNPNNFLTRAKLRTYCVHSNCGKIDSSIYSNKPSAQQIAEACASCCSYKFELLLL